MWPERPSVSRPSSAWNHQKLDVLNQLLARDSPGQSSIVAPVAGSELTCRGRD